MKTIKNNNKRLKTLYTAISKLENAAECQKFLEDLCTVSELGSMAERFAVAGMVDREIPYREISRKVGSSTATVTRVAHWLHHGKGGYKLILERM